MSDEYLGVSYIADDILAHYGTKRHSGRYPWGSGENPYQHSGDWLSRIDQMRRDGMSEKDIADGEGMSIKDLRAYESIAKQHRKVDDLARIRSLQADGLNNSEIGRRLGMSESTIRSMLEREQKFKEESAFTTAEFLRSQIDSKGPIDIGKGVEAELHVSRDRLDQARYILEGEGYTFYPLGVPQVTNPGQQTNFQIICPPGMSYKEAYDAAKNNGVHYIHEYASNDDGKTFKTFQYPESLDSSRIKINYGDQGGSEKDGVIELRRGVDDISLGESSYAQVRVLVDGTHYLKGMAVYSDNMPDGVDVIFNTNKPSGTPKEKVFKEIKRDKDGNPMENPFGAYIKPTGQREYIDSNGEKKLGVINKVHEEGEWGDYSVKLPSQFLSKQSQSLVKNQLNLTYADYKEQYDDICNLTNPTLKRSMLNEFADTCDGAAIHLKAASLPRQSTKVILPVPELKDNEIYAPTYDNGEHVVLIRYPHGGTFEIPELIVNNKRAKVKDILGNAPDAVGINAKVANQLSGADFDGDTVTVIPINDKVKVTHKKALDELKDFDPKIEYAGTDISKRMKNTQNEMGKISNLITDMTVAGAPSHELARAVKHSMVVIDAEKHGLDYQRSFKENGIAELKDKYQGRYNKDGRWTTSASTIISRASAQESVPKRQGSANIDPRTGKKTYKEIDFIDENGKRYFRPSKESGELSYKTGKPRMQKSTQMAETDDAYTLVSKYQHPNERLYADYANKMKAMANEARKTALNTKGTTYDRHAKDIYKTEVDSLNTKLLIANKTKPKERQAQIIANGKVNAIKNSNPELKIDTPETKKELKKIKQQAIEEARVRVGSSRKDRTITLTDREWEAIQAGAVSSSKASEIFSFMDSTELKQRATPKSFSGVSNAQIAKIKAMSSSGYTIAEIAERMGKSPSTISKYIKS